MIFSGDTPITLINHPIPILITWDIDPDQWVNFERRQNALSMAVNLCEEFNIRSTFFITANYAHEYIADIERMLILKQEIGCHGLNHTDEEDYDRMPSDLQRSYIVEAKRKLEAVAGSPIHSFRSPRVKTSALTMNLLSNIGYQADSSICSQRMDLISSNLIKTDWIIAPRLPYHPHPDNAFKRGSLPIWEVPISAALVPFISSSLKVLGLRSMKALFWLLYKEARITGKPIVYLGHPTEFLPFKRHKAALSRDNFSIKRVRTHGFLARRLMYRLVGQSLYEATRELFAYISSFPDVIFMSCNEYVRELNTPTRSKVP